MNLPDNSGSHVFINYLSVSAPQGVLIFSIIAIFILLEKYRFGILALCFYCLHWVFIAPQAGVAQNFSSSELGMFLFLGFSFAALGVASVFQKDNFRKI